MKKLIIFILAAMVALFSMGCNSMKPAATTAPAQETQATQEQSAAPTEEPVVKETVNVVALKGPTGMGMVKMMQDSESGTANNQYQVELSNAPDDVTAKILSGEVDIAAIPTNLAAALYKKSDGAIQMLAINTLGVLYILEDGDTIHSVADLKGKTIKATGQAATPEYVLNYILEKNGLTPGTDVTVDYLADHSELATLMAAGTEKLGMLPQPFVTSAMLKNSNLRIALDLTAEWNKVSEGTQLVMGCIVARKEFIDAHPEAIANFLADYSASTEYVNNNIEEASQLIAQYGIMATPEAAADALPSCNIVCITGQDMINSASNMFQVLYDADPKSVGGALPDAALYYLQGVTQ